MIFSKNTIIKSKLFLIVTAALFLSVFLLSCGGGAIGYGVVLISPDTRVLPTGSVVEVLEESGIQKTYIVVSIDSSERLEIDKWRIQIFEEMTGAVSLAESYKEYINLYARNIRDGLAIREKPDINSNRVYKMRIDQEVKILQKNENIEQIGSHEGYWYKVITLDGVEGYCFDYYLDIYDITAAVAEDLGPDISRLTAAFEKVYRPEVFQSMMDSRQIFLDKFSKEYGLFSDPEKKIIRVQLFDKSYEFEYSTVKQTGESRYLLLPSELEVIIKSENTIQLVFTLDDITYDPVFIYIEEELIDDIRTGELERRSELFSSLIENGPLYTSSAYGSIRFMENNTFSWERLGRLVPAIIPDDDYSEGKITFDHFAVPNIEGNYDGVLAFRFRQNPDRPILLLFSLENRSLKLEYVPNRNADNGVIMERSSSPLIMAFFGQQ